MTAPTGTREPEMGLTFEKVWAMFQESDRRMQKLSEETDRKMRETDRKMQETAQQMRETDLMIQEVAQHIKKTDENIGRLGNRFGELAEHLVAPNIVRKFNALGFHFSDISTGLRKIVLDESSGQKIAEFDIILENSESIIGVEVKAKPSERDVENHSRRLEILRRHRDKIGDRRKKIHGALAGAIMPDSVKAAALEEGMYVITQTGDTVKINVPEGFVPKTW
jgi:hypothetical protein